MTDEPEPITQSIIKQADRLRKITRLSIKLEIENDRLTARVAELEAFRKAVLGWREYDHPEGFCRFSAEYVANLGREALNRGRDDE